LRGRKVFNFELLTGYPSHQYNGMLSCVLALSSSAVVEIPMTPLPILNPLAIALPDGVVLV
jgi:hypothetical protein